MKLHVSHDPICIAAFRLTIHIPKVNCPSTQEEEEKLQDKIQNEILNALEDCLPEEDDMTFKLDWN